MGIARGAYRLLLEEKKKGVLKGGAILQLGRQSILFNQSTLYKYAHSHGVQLEDVKPRSSGSQEAYIDDITLFNALGFKEVHSLDYSDFEGANLIWDLNCPIPEKYWGKFDVIYDGGTGEHVFHFPQFLTNIHLLLKEGGIIIHASPSNNHVDHGFYMFSPQVHSEYYMANHYRILTSQIIEYSPNHKRPWQIYAYQPGILDKLSYGNFGKRMLLIHLIAQKTPKSTSGVPPQQIMKVNPETQLGTSLKKKIQCHLPFFIKRSLQRRKLTPVAKY